MPTPTMRTARVISIASLVCSIIALLCWIALTAMTALTVAALSQPAVADSMSRSLSSDPDSLAFMEQHGLSTGDILGFGGFAGTLLIIACVVGIVLCILPIVTSALGMKRFDQPGRLKPLFGLSIASAVMCFFIGNIVSLVLYIVLAVLVWRIRSLDGSPRQPIEVQPTAAQ